jgi:hypothetical protein
MKLGGHNPRVAGCKTESVAPVRMLMRTHATVCSTGAHTVSLLLLFASYNIWERKRYSL